MLTECIRRRKGVLKLDISPQLLLPFFKAFYSAFSDMTCMFDFCSVVKMSEKI